MIPGPIGHLRHYHHHCQRFAKTANIKWNEPCSDILHLQRLHAILKSFGQINVMITLTVLKKQDYKIFENMRLISYLQWRN